MDGWLGGGAVLNHGGGDVSRERGGLVNGSNGLVMAWPGMVWLGGLQ